MIRGGSSSACYLDHPICMPAQPARKVPIMALLSNRGRKPTQRELQLAYRFVVEGEAGDLPTLDNGWVMTLAQARHLASQHVIPTVRKHRNPAPRRARKSKNK